MDGSPTDPLAEIGASMFSSDADAVDALHRAIVIVVFL